MSLPENLPAVVEQALYQNNQNNENMARLVAQMAQIAAGLDRRLRMLEEQLSQKVTITHAQSKQLTAAMRERSEEICAKYDLDVKLCAGTIRSAMLKDIKKRFGIADLHDLPAGYMTVAMQAIREWTSYALVRKIRDKQHTGG